MVITNLQEKENRKLWVPIRDGNRGGWSLFNWEDVREMPYKDRQMYLGNSSTIGVLDKGGKWRKRDWYNHAGKKYQLTSLKEQQMQAIRRDEERMNMALGIKQQDEQKLTQYEMRELMKKIKMKKQGVDSASAPDAIGLGFDKMKVQIRAKPSVKMQNPHKLEAFDQLKKYDNEQEQKFEKNQKNQKRQKQKKEKEKKQKKSKKEKKKKDKQNQQKQTKRSQNDDQQRHKKKKEKKQKKQKKQKHRNKQKQQYLQHQRRRDRSRSQEKRRRKHSSSSSSSSDSN